MSGKKTGKPYVVGYGKPPVKSQFQPGQSGNSKGRPKGSRNKFPHPSEERWKKTILTEAYREIEVRDGERLLTFSVFKSAFRQLSLNAASGNIPSQRIFFNMLERVEKQRSDRHEEFLKAMIEFKFWAENELDRREKTGATGRNIFPHPDDIHIDFVNNTVRITGPMTKEQPVWLDEFCVAKNKCREGIEQLETLLEETPDDVSIQEELDQEKGKLETYRRVLSVYGR